VVHYKVGSCPFKDSVYPWQAFQAGLNFLVRPRCLALEWGTVRAPFGQAPGPLAKN